MVISIVTTTSLHPGASTHPTIVDRLIISMEICMIAYCTVQSVAPIFLFRALNESWPFWRYTSTVPSSQICWRLSHPYPNLDVTKALVFSEVSTWIDCPLINHKGLLWGHFHIVKIGGVLSIIYVCDIWKLTVENSIHTRTIVQRTYNNVPFNDC